MPLVWRLEVSEADSSSAARRSGRNVVSQVAAVDDGWREGILVLLIVLAPMALAVMLTAIAFSITAVWQWTHTMPVTSPTPASIRLHGMVSYALGCWIAVALAWRWSSRRQLRREVFAFRRPSWAALTV